MHADTIAPEAACTSVQFHLQVSPQDYAANWNAAQCIAGVQVALGANSPFLFGKELWRETRIALFEQATDTRPQELKAQGVRPAGVVRRAVDHLGLRPVRGERPLLPGAAAGLRRRGSGRGARPRRHPPAGRAADAQRHHLPLEPAGVRRVPGQAAPAGREPGAAGRADRRRRPRQRRLLLRPAAHAWPSRTGRCGRRCRSPPPRRTSRDGARHGIHAQLYWPGLGEVPATELVLRRLLPMAQQGLAAWGVDTAVSDRLLGVIERRCTAYLNGAEWQAETFHRIDEQRQPLDRRDALREMLRRYVEHMHTNEPVADWPIDCRLAATGQRFSSSRIHIAEQSPVVRDEVVVLVRRERGPHRLDEQPVEVGTAHPVEHDLVEVGQPAGAEVRVAPRPGSSRRPGRDRPAASRRRTGRSGRRCRSTGGCPGRTAAAGRWRCSRPTTGRAPSSPTGSSSAGWSARCRGRRWRSRSGRRRRP